MFRNAIQHPPRWWCYTGTCWHQNTHHLLWALSGYQLHFCIFWWEGSLRKTSVKHGIITARSPWSIKGPFQNTVLHSASFAVSITTMKGWKNVLYNLQDSIQTRKHIRQLQTCTYASLSRKGNTHTHKRFRAYSAKICDRAQTHTQILAQTAVWYICKDAITRCSGQENKTKDLWGGTLLYTRLQIIHFMLIDNQSSGSFQTGYPIRHLRTISLPATHKVCLLHSSKT